MNSAARKLIQTFFKEFWQKLAKRLISGNLVAPPSEVENTPTEVEASIHPESNA
jgi:hypothetical protein